MKWISGILSLLSLTACLIFPILLFLQKLAGQEFKTWFLMASLGWFLFASIFLIKKNRRSPNRPE